MRALELGERELSALRELVEKQSIKVAAAYAIPDPKAPAPGDAAAIASNQTN
jgi:hypothetical protein